jgi:hypothetical protein
LQRKRHYPFGPQLLAKGGAKRLIWRLRRPEALQYSYSSKKKGSILTPTVDVSA